MGDWGAGEWREAAVCLVLFVCLFWPSSVACGILVPRPGTEPGPSAVRVWSPNHWTTREFPEVLNRVRRKASLEGVTFEQNMKEVREWAMWVSGGRAGAKALRLECTWSVGGRRRSPGKLEKSGEGRAGGMGPES